MEFFEKAHTVKRKPYRSEENTKKQIKQMLHGFKQNDTKAIKSSADLRFDLEDTVSYSSFSDPDLINPISNETITFQDSSDTQVNDVDSNISSIVENDKDSDVNSKNDNASISDVIEDLKSLSEESDNNQEMESFQIASTSEDSVSFDPDGGLAANIRSKLNKRPLSETTQPKKKSKLSNLNAMMSDWVIEEVAHRPLPNTCVIDSSSQTYLDDSVNVNSESKVVVESSEPLSSESEDGPSPPVQPQPLPQPFVQYEAKDFEDKPLTEVMRGYNFSTAKNLPTDVFVVEDEAEEVFPAVLHEHSDNNSEGSDGLESISSSMVVDELSIPASPQEPEPDQSNLQDNEDEACKDIDVTDNQDVVESTITIDDKPITVYYTQDSCIFVLKHPTKLYLHGKVQIQLLGGSAKVLGYSLKDKVSKIFAPHYNCAQYIETQEHGIGYFGLFNKLTTAGLTVAETEDIVTTLGEFDAVIQLKALECSRMDFVEDNFGVADLFRKLSKNIDPTFTKACDMLKCSLYLEKPLKCFYEKADWGQVNKFYSDTKSRGIVCGGKNTGKSTFLRYHVNKWLAQGPVLLVDLDPGQSELTVPGNVSATVIREPLLGPSFTHLMEPDILLNIGLINVMENVQRYTKAITELIKQCDEKYPNMPWAINTMGMCNSLGLKLIIFIIILVKPTFILQIDSKNLKQRFESILNPQVIKVYCEKFKNKRDNIFKYVNINEMEYELILCQDDAENAGKRSSYSLAARDERYLSFLAYFGSVVVGRRSTNLLAVVPYEVPLRELKIATNVNFTQDATCKVLNGKIIALCQHIQSERPSPIFTQKDKPLLCHGHALIRGVDSDRGVLYMLTPISREKLSRVNSLVYADWMPELRAEADLPDGTRLPYRTDTPHQQKQLMFTPKRRFNPVQFLKTAKNNLNQV